MIRGCGSRVNMYSGYVSICKRVMGEDPYSIEYIEASGTCTLEHAST
jgi:hypothetical protein